MRIVSFASVFVAAIVLCGAAQAQEAQCISPDRWQADYSAGIVETFLIGTLTGQKAIDAAAAYNASPPATNAEADQIVVLGGKIKETGEVVTNVLFGLFKDGCLTKYTEMTSDFAMKLLNPGEGA
jgi:hypothetical protein